MGLVKAEIRREWRITDPVAVLEVKSGPLMGHVFDGKSFTPIATYPSIARDMAMIVDEAIKHGDVLDVVRKVAPKELEKVELFDIFTGRGIASGKKSMAFSFTYRSLMRTLTDEEANQYHQTVKDALKRELGVEVRES